MLQAVNNYAAKRKPNDATAASSSLANGPVGRVLRSTPRKQATASELTAGPIWPVERRENAKRVLDNFYFIRLAYENPKNYLRGLSHVYMTVELVALMTPMIAMGIQWLTALCPAPPLQSLWPMFVTMGGCLIHGDFQCQNLQDSCIVA